jgi:hypothetical protein
MKKKIKIFGNKTNALFDWWSLVHACVFYVLTILFLIKLELLTAILALIVIAYGWETIERYLENNNRIFKKYFIEKECWANRYIGDPLANAIGFILAYLIH